MARPGRVARGHRGCAVKAPPGCDLHRVRVRHAFRRSVDPIPEWRPVLGVGIDSVVDRGIHDIVREKQSGSPQRGIGSRLIVSEAVKEVRAAIGTEIGVIPLINTAGSVGVAATEVSRHAMDTPLIPIMVARGDDPEIPVQLRNAVAPMPLTQVTVGGMKRGIRRASIAVETNRMASIENLEIILATLSRKMITVPASRAMLVTRDHPPAREAIVMAQVHPLVVAVRRG